MPLNAELCTDTATWDSFAAGVPNASVFSTRPWLSSLDREYALVVVRQDDAILCGAPIMLKDGNGDPEPIPFAQYCGILIGAAVMERPVHSRVKVQGDAVTALLSFASEKYGALALTLEPDFSDMRPFQWLNYHEPARGVFALGLRYTGLINLPSADGFDGYVDSIRSVRRQEYRRALREGFVVEDSSDVGLLEALHEKTFARQGLQRPQREIDLLASITTRALEQGFGTICTVRRPGEDPVGATLFLHDAEKCYYLVGANDPDYRQTGASVLLFLEHARRYARRKVGTLDVVGINSPNRGDFKTSFNAVPAAYFRAEWQNDGV